MVTPLAFLSWNTARLLALTFNAFAGLLQYYGHDLEKLDGDSIFALRVLQSYLDEIHLNLNNANFHQNIFATIKNISVTAGDTARHGAKELEKRDPATFNALSVLLERHLNIYINRHQKVDENLRWANKNLLSRDEIHKSKAWFIREDSSDFFNCTALLASNSCENITSRCFDKIMRPKGLIGFEISRQIFFVFVTKVANCSKSLEQYLDSNSILSGGMEQESSNYNRSKIETYVAERCANMHDELLRYRRDKKKLARVMNPSLDLMMEQVFVCLQFGYIEFANPHFLVTALAWQHPILGCYTNHKPESIPNMGLSADFQRHDNIQLKQSAKEDSCVAHTSAAVTIALAMYLRFLLDPGPWPEFHFADQLVQIDRISAEDHFLHFKYIEWVRDSSLHLMQHSQKILPKPPPIAWSPDLIAFVILLFVFAVGSVIAHYIWGNSGGISANFKLLEYHLRMNQSLTIWDRTEKLTKRVQLQVFAQRLFAYRKVFIWQFRDGELHCVSFWICTSTCIIFLGSVISL